MEGFKIKDRVTGLLLKSNGEREGFDGFHERAKVRVQIFRYRPFAKRVKKRLQGEGYDPKIILSMDRPTKWLL